GSAPPSTSTCPGRGGTTTSGPRRTSPPFVTRSGACCARTWSRTRRPWRMIDTGRRGHLQQACLRHPLFALALFLAWEGYARILDEPVLLPGPTAVLTALGSIVIDGSLFPALLESLRLLAIGFATAVALGVLIGIVVGRYRVMDRTFSPYFNGLYALPVAALVPLVLIWFGFGLLARAIVVFLSAFFPHLSTTHTGAPHAPSDLLDVARAFGVSCVSALLSRVVVPAAISLGPP